MPALVGATTIAGVIIIAQTWSFSWPRDDESNLVRCLQKHAMLLAVAGLALIMIGNAMHSLLRRVAELERRLAESARSEAT